MPAGQRGAAHPCPPILRRHARPPRQPARARPALLVAQPTQRHRVRVLRATGLLLLHAAILPYRPRRPQRGPHHPKRARAGLPRRACAKAEGGAPPPEPLPPAARLTAEHAPRAACLCVKTRGSLHLTARGRGGAAHDVARRWSPCQETAPRLWSPSAGSAALLRHSQQATHWGEISACEGIPAERRACAMLAARPLAHEIQGLPTGPH
jgi:hypothetical protein